MTQFGFVAGTGQSLRAIICADADGKALLNESVASCSAAQKPDLVKDCEDKDPASEGAKSDGEVKYF